MGKRRAFVSGSSGGIGEAIVRRLAARGYAVAVHGRRAEQVQRIVREIQEKGGEAVAVLGDLAVPGIPESVARQAADALGGLDLVVNNAGVVLLGASEELPLDAIRRLFEINLFASVAINNAVIPAMREQRSGRIIHISSIAGWLPTPYLGLYCASKHALLGYAEALDQEVCHFGIRVCTVQPGFTKTDIGRNAAVIPHPLAEYETIRQRAVGWIESQIEHGVSPSSVARIVTRAATTPFPKRHYLVGARPRIFRILRSIVPAPLFGWGLRKVMRLD